jgi:hypothetical protein
MGGDYTQRIEFTSSKSGFLMKPAGDGTDRVS